MSKHYDGKMTIMDSWNVYLMKRETLEMLEKQDHPLLEAMLAAKNSGFYGSRLIPTNQGVWTATTIITSNTTNTTVNPCNEIFLHSCKVEHPLA